MRKFGHSWQDFQAKGLDNPGVIVLVETVDGSQAFVIGDVSPSGCGVRYCGSFLPEALVLAYDERLIKVHQLAKTAFLDEYFYELAMRGVEVADGNRR